MCGNMVNIIGVIVVPVMFSILSIHMNNKNSYAQTENEIRKSITDATNKLTDIWLNNSLENCQNREQYVKVAIEQYLNAYEDACAKYLDSKVDKKRFRKLYMSEIKNLVEDRNLNQYFQFGSKYGAIKKVYSKWYDLE